MKIEAILLIAVPILTILSSGFPGKVFQFAHIIPLSLHLERGTTKAKGEFKPNKVSYNNDSCKTGTSIKH